MLTRKSLLAVAALQAIVLSDIPFAPVIRNVPERKPKEKTLTDADLQAIAKAEEKRARKQAAYAARKK